MADRTAIEWSDATWNCIAGCSRMSEGCRNCFAERLAARGLPGFEGLARFVDRTGGTREARWTGAVEVREHLMDQPYRWRRPRRIFVNSMADLFHDAVPDEVIDRVFGVMAGASRHTFQILTKRPERMRRYLARWQSCGKRMGWHTPEGSKPTSYGGSAVHMIPSDQWPLPNVWLGVSVEDQVTADVRIPYLLSTPAAIRFISFEPALGFADIAWALSRNPIEIAAGFLKRG